jgi:hypothetical protein
METLIVPGPLQTKLGPQASEGLGEMFSLYHQIATDRLERRLTEELSALRLEMHQGFASLRQEDAATRVELLKWSFVFWVGQVAAVAGLLAYMLPAAGL